MKNVLTLIVILFATASHAGSVEKNANGSYSQTSGILLGGNNYAPGEVCYTGSKLMTLVTKVATFQTIDSDGETTGKRVRNSYAGKLFDWKFFTRIVRDHDGETIGKKTYKRNGSPKWEKTTCPSFNSFHSDSDAYGKGCNSTYIAVPMCDDN